MSALYGRVLKLLFVASDGHALDMSELHVQFSIKQWETMSPNTLDARIYNVSLGRSLRIGPDNEFKRVVVQAGYSTGAVATIFDGSVVQMRRGRATPVDTYIDVTAADADLAHNYAVVNQTLAAGATPDDLHKCLLNSMAGEPYNITAGYTDALPGPALPRGRAIYGMTRDHLRDLADNTDCVWNMRDGRLNMVSHKGYMPGETIVLTSATGLIGLPQQTQDGIMIRSLLDSRLKVNNQVQINNESIQQARIDPTFLKGGGNPIQSGVTIDGVFKPGTLPEINKADGVYRVLALDHSGDTRGQPWYTDMTCISVDPTARIPDSQLQRLRGGTEAPSVTPGQPVLSPPSVTGNTTN